MIIRITKVIRVISVANYRIMYDWGRKLIKRLGVGGKNLEKTVSRKLSVSEYVCD